VISPLTLPRGGTRWRSWLRHCGGSIPDVATEFFNWHYTSGRTMSLVSTQLLTKIRTRIFDGGYRRPAYGWQIYHLHVPVWETQTPGNLWACNRPPQELFYRLLNYQSYASSHCSSRGIKHRVDHSKIKSVIMHDVDSGNTWNLKYQWVFCYDWGSQNNVYEVLCSVASCGLAEIY